MSTRALKSEMFSAFVGAIYLLFCTDLFAQETGLARFDRVAAVSSMHESQKKLSTAYFVLHKDRLLMMTAKHTALEMNLTSEVALPSSGPLRIFRLAETLKKTGVNPWTLHTSADVALCELDLSKLREPLNEQVKSMAISADHFSEKPLTRSSRIECFGFPMGLGITAERISPLATTCFVASEELLVDGTWGKESVFFATPSAGSGTSGGLVTLHDDDPETCRVVGMFIGGNSDATGAKLSRIVPASVLVSFIESQSE